MNEKQLKILKLGMNECGVTYGVVCKFYDLSPTWTLKKLVETGYLTLGEHATYYTTDKGKRYVQEKMDIVEDQTWIRT